MDGRPVGPCWTDDLRGTIRAIEWVGFPASCAGASKAGGPTATLIGLGAAQQHAGARLGPASVSRRQLKPRPAAEPRVVA